jgi:hypothetical protein
MIIGIDLVCSLMASITITGVPPSANPYGRAYIPNVPGAQINMKGSPD